MYICKISGITWNNYSLTLDSTYLWCDCRDITRTKIMYSLFFPFECLYLWWNYSTKWRTNIINMVLWRKMMSLNCYETNTYKQIMSNWRTVPTGTKHHKGHQNIYRGNIFRPESIRQIMHIPNHFLQGIIREMLISCF